MGAPLTLPEVMTRACGQSCLLKKEVMQRCIGQHHADFVDAGGEIGGKAGLTVRGEQNDRVRRARGAAFLPLRSEQRGNRTASMSGTIIARGLAGLPLRLRRRSTACGRSGIHRQMKTAESADGQNFPACAGRRPPRAAGSSQGSRLPVLVVPEKLGTADRAGIRLGVKSSVGRDPGIPCSQSAHIGKTFIEVFGRS